MSTPKVPTGFEDGHIVGYEARSGALEVEYEFWNEKRGTILFHEFIGMRDLGAIGVIIGALAEKRDGPFAKDLLARLYESPPQELRWLLFQFLDLDDVPMFEVVAESWSFETGQR